MNQIEKYIIDRDEQVRRNLTDKDLERDTKVFTEALVRTNYIKNFSWMGVPVIQYPQDLMIMQELIWQVKPDFIIETGIAFGGMTKFYSQMLEPMNGQVFSIDIDIRPHAVEVLKELSNVHSIEMSSIDPWVIEEITIPKWADVLVSLDSNHTADHVLKELELYSPLVSVGSYIVVFDTAIEFYGHLDKNQDRAWHPGNSPYTAVQEFLKHNDNFVVDREIEQRAVITSAIGGYLRRVK